MENPILHMENERYVEQIWHREGVLTLRKWDKILRKDVLIKNFTRDGLEVLPRFEIKNENRTSDII